ncbi:MAG: hypothetical protein IJS88_05760 [Alphaproteobacteria bacterium]|nr:hypothetical protein [Alphaproteobacteria bacterium]
MTNLNHQVILITLTTNGWYHLREEGVYCIIFFGYSYLIICSAICMMNKLNKAPLEVNPSGGFFCV